MLRCRCVNIENARSKAPSSVVPISSTAATQQSTSPTADGMAFIHSSTFRGPLHQCIPGKTQPNASSTQTRRHAEEENEEQKRGFRLNCFIFPKLRGSGSRLAAGAHALEDALAVLVDLELGDEDLRGVDADGDGRAVGLLAGNALDVHDVFEAVDGGDLALTALVGAAHDGDFVVLADGDGADLHRDGIRIGVH